MSGAVHVLMMDAPAGTGIDAWADDLVEGMSQDIGGVELTRHKLPSMARFFPRAFGRWGRKTPSAEVYHFDPWIGPTVPRTGHRLVTVHLVVHGDLRYDGHRGWLRSGWHRVLEEREIRSISGADTVVAVSEHVAERVYELCGRRSIVIPNGIDTGLFRPRKHDVDRIVDSKPRIVSVGTASRRKGFDTLLGLAATLSPEFDFVHAGPVDAVSRRRGESVGIEMRGPMARKSVAQLLRGADVFLTCSRCEGFGLAVAEAMATGLPVVGLTIPTTVELLGRDGGVLVERDEDLGAGLRSAVEEMGSWGCWADRNRERACARYDRSRMVLGYGRLYEELAR